MFCKILFFFRCDMENLSKINPFFGKYPFVEFLVGLGIFLVYLIEEFIGLFNNDSGGHSHSPASSLPILQDQQKKVHIFKSATKKKSLSSSSIMNTHGHCCHQIS